MSVKQIGGNTVIQLPEVETVEVDLEQLGIFSALATKIDGARQLRFTGNLDLETNKIVNVVDPTSDQDAATKKYVDDNSGGGGGSSSVGAVNAIQSSNGSGGFADSGLTGSGGDMTSTGTVIVRQDGGTAGVDEGQLSHNGTDFVVDPKSGNIDVVNNNIASVKNLTYEQEYDNGVSGGSKTITWGNGSKQKITLNSADATLSFVDPPGPADLTLKLTQDNIGNRDVTWNGTQKAPNGVLSLSSASASVDLAHIHFDGADYFMTIDNNFQDV